MLPKCNENRKFQEESPPGQHLEKGLEACHGPCNQEGGRTDGACFAAGKFMVFDGRAASHHRTVGTIYLAPFLAPAFIHVEAYDIK